MIRQVRQPESLDSAVVGDEHAAIAFLPKLAVDGDCVDVDGAIPWCSGVGRDCPRRGVCDGGRGMYVATVVVRDEVSLGALGQRLGAQASALDRRVNQRWIILNDGIVVERVHEDNLALDED